MKQERIRVTKMAGELINDFLTFLGCNNINLHICEDPDAFLIHITGVFQDLSEERLQRMKNLLCQPRNYELEEMYWSFFFGSLDIVTSSVIMPTRCNSASVSLSLERLQYISSNS